MPDEPASILFIGDVVGGLGRRTLLALLPGLIERHRPTFVVVNAENVAGGLGITPKIADELLRAGVDVITLGNHAYHRKEIYPYLDAQERVIRPANYLRSQPGRGSVVVERDGVRLGVVSLSGNLYLRAGRPAFVEIDAVLGQLEGKVDHVLVDMHAEATSEKVGMGWFLDGRATAVVGTHTHVPTADARVLPGGTAYVTDVGHDRPARRRHRRAQGAGDRVAAHAHVGALRDLRGRPVAHGRAHPLRRAAAARQLDRAAPAALGPGALSARARKIRTTKGWSPDVRPRAQP